MLYLYIGSIIISYLTMKSNIETIEKQLKEMNLNAKETENDKIDMKIVLLIISCLPIINLIILISVHFSKENLYNTIKEAQCGFIIQDNKELKYRYRRICKSGNEEQRRKLEKKISLLTN